MFYRHRKKIELAQSGANDIKVGMGFHDVNKNLESLPRLVFLIYFFGFEWISMTFVSRMLIDIHKGGANYELVEKLF